MARGSSEDAATARREDGGGYESDVPLRDVLSTQTALWEASAQGVEKFVSGRGPDRYPFFLPTSLQEPLLLFARLSEYSVYCRI